MTAVLSPGQIPDAFQDSNVPAEWQEDLNVHMVCPDCQEYPPNLVENFADGDTVCGSCGLVLDNRIVDTRSEWRTFANDEGGSDDPSRVGSAADPLYYGSQLETAIAWADGDKRARDLHRAHAKLETDTNNKTLREAYDRLGTYCANMSLPDNTLHIARETFKEVHDQKNLKGKNMTNTLAGCLFIASRKTGNDRTFKAITNATGVSKKEIGRAFKAIETSVREKRALKIRAGAIGPISDLDVVHAATKPTVLIEPLCQNLYLNRLVIKTAREVAQKLMDTMVIDGRSPLTIAAVAVYFASHLMGQPKSPKEIAAYGSVSDGTIRTSYKLVINQLDIIMEQRWLADGGKRELLPGA